MMSSNLTFHDASYYDDLYAIQVLPAIVILALLMLVGFVGNSLVFYIYVRKFKSSTTKDFISSLAVIDLLSCLIGIPFAISLMRYNYTAGNYTYCSVLSTVNHFTSIASVTILSAVACDRFRKICKPLDTQMTPFVAKIAIGGCCCFAFALAVPAAFIYGSKSVQTPGNATGSVCGEADTLKGTMFPLVYNVVLFGLFLTVCTVLIVIYAFIWRRMSRRKLFRKEMSGEKSPKHQKLNTLKEQSNTVSTPSVEPSLASSDDDYIDKPNSDAISGRRMIAADHSNSIETPTQLTPMKEKDKTKGNTLKMKRKKRGFRKTLMLFMITLIFVLSFLPYLGLIVATVIDTDFINNLQGVTLFAYNLFERSYFINSVSNPIIYSFYCMKFRREVRMLFRRR